jgi:hypothetical protein
MDYERGEVATDSLPGFIFIGIRFCTCVGLMFPPPYRIVKIMSRVGQLSALKVLSGKGILISHWPSKLGDRSNPTREVVSPTSSTSPILQMETTSGSGNSPSRILILREVWKFLGLRESSQSGRVVTTTPSQNFHVHRCIQFRLGSPCERGRFNHEGHVVSGGGQDVYQHLGTQGSPARCKSLSEPSKEPDSVYPLPCSLQNDMGTSHFAVART